MLCGWLFLLSGMATAQTTISSVEIFGNSFFSQRDILDKIPSKSGAPLNSIERSKIILQDIYSAEGYYSFSIDSVRIEYSVDSSNAQVAIFLNEKERTLVSEVIVSGNKAFTSRELLALIETASGVPLNSPLLESDIRSVLTFYSQQGFPFAKISADSIHTDPADHSKLIVQLNVEEGPKVYLDEIRVEGNTSTSAAVVVREARVGKGELFNQDKLEKIRRRLERLQLFVSVGDPQLYILPGLKGDSLRGGLSIPVTEGNTNTFDGIVGYVPSTVPSVSGYFTGNVFVALRNLFGTGRKALIKWQRETSVTQELELQYREPWLFGFPLGIGGTFFQRKQDSSYVKTKIELRGDFAFSEELTVAGNILSESVYPSADLSQFTVFESNALFFGGEILYDTRDNVRNPTGGISYAATIQQGTKKITGPKQFLNLSTGKNFSIQKYSVDAAAFVSTFSRQVIMFGVHGKQISSSQLELSDLFQFGGATTMRGYRENQFFASQIVYINSEYRFLTGRASSLFGFIDAGYFSRPADPFKGITRQEKSLYGFGFGARVETGLGILNISYALGQGDSFSNGKIHVGIINEF